MNDNNDKNFAFRAPTIWDSALGVKRIKPVLSLPPEWKRLEVPGEGLKVKVKHKR